MAAIAIIVWASQFTSQAKRDWDINSYADQQLEIRIHAYLASTMMVLVFTLQLMSLLLFVYNAERMLEFFATSAMTLSVAMMPPFGTPPI